MNKRIAEFERPPITRDEAAVLEPKALAVALETDLVMGLASPEARKRLETFGSNVVAADAGLVWPALLLRQIRSVLILLLIIATLVSALLGEWLNVAAIAVSVVVSVAFGFVNEFQSERSIAALKPLTAPRAQAIRDGGRIQIDAGALVPGDLISIAEGDLVPADGRILVSRGLMANEAILTGESLSAEKDPLPSPMDGSTSPSLALAGTTIVAGSALVVVIATGRATMLGEIATAVSSPRRRATPLESRLERLGRQLVAVFIVACVAVAAAGIAAGRDARNMIELGVSLAIGAVPEGLPAVATASLAVAVRRLARLQVLVRQLDAVETLESTTVIVSDKTGTLTENRIALHSILLPDGRELSVHVQLDEAGIITRTGAEPALAEAAREVLMVAGLCNDASIEYDEALGWHGHGDPLEVALLFAAAGAGWDRATLDKFFPRTRTVAFTSSRRLMETVHSGSEGEMVALKGAVEKVSERIGGLAPEARAGAHDRAREGYRLIGVAREGGGETGRFLGIIVLEDPIRRDAAESVARCRQAGVRLVLATGDDLHTAETVAREVGLLDERALALRASDLPLHDLDEVAVIARATHRQKEDLVNAFQDRGEIVAMLGDGVNDAPAMRSADVAIAVGSGATDVAVGAAQAVIADSRLMSLVAGILEGRQAARGLRQAIVYLLAASFATIGFIAVAMTFDEELPLDPLQVLWLNLVVHLFPALALATGRDDREYSDRPTSTLIAEHTWWEIGWRAFTAAAGSTALFAFAVGRGEPLGVRQSVAFTGLAATLVGQVLVVGIRHPARQMGRLRRPEIWLAIALSVVLVVLALHVDPVRERLNLARLSLRWWMAIAAVSFVTINASQLGLLALRRWLIKDERRDFFT